jgi:hypothetical protein
MKRDADKPGKRNQRTSTANEARKGANTYKLRMLMKDNWAQNCWDKGNRSRGKRPHSLKIVY